ncbi:YobA family protein [Oceanobacillus iheyensis]|uniref:YobA family protein n=1 Tax=Oceanobacillus iheyensis TaxID=182710 RepID=UPI003638F70C
MMNKLLSYLWKILLFALFIVPIFYLLIMNVDKNDQVQVDVDYQFTSEGYVVSKRLTNKIWIADEPTSLINRITGHLFSEHKGLIIVLEHRDVKGNNLFHNISVNQKVRVYSDKILESSPARTNAYLVEVIDE